MDYGKLAIWILDELGLEYDYIEREHKTDYIHCLNPVIDESQKSCQIFVEDGWCHSWNGSIKGKERISLKEVFKQNGYTKEYIEWLLQENDIPIYNLNNYRDLLMKKALKENYSYKKFNKLKKLFGELYISASDVLSIGEVKPIHEKKFEPKKKNARKKSKMTEIEMTDVEYNKCKAYIENRCIDLVEGKIEPVKVEFSSGFQVIGIAFRYPDGEMSKYRLLGDGFRYVSSGRYNKFYETQISEHKNMCHVVEGEICSESLAKVVDETVFAMHNLNSINEGGLLQLEPYNKVIILIDNDKFNEVQENLIKKVSSRYPDKEIICKPKFDSNNKDLDVNSFLMNKGLEALDIYIKKHIDKLMESC